MSLSIVSRARKNCRFGRVPPPLLSRAATSASSASSWLLPFTVLQFLQWRQNSSANKNSAMAQRIAYLSSESTALVKAAPSPSASVPRLKVPLSLFPFPLRVRILLLHVRRGSLSLPPLPFPLCLSLCVYSAEKGEGERKRAPSVASPPPMNDVLCTRKTARRCYENRSEGKRGRLLFLLFYV